MGREGGRKKGKRVSTCDDELYSHFIASALCVCVSQKIVVVEEKSLTTKRVLTCHQEHLRMTQRIFIEFESEHENRFDVRLLLK